MSKYVIKRLWCDYFHIIRPTCYQSSGSYGNKVKRVWYQSNHMISNLKIVHIIMQNIYNVLSQLCGQTICFISDSTCLITIYFDTLILTCQMSQKWKSKGDFLNGEGKPRAKKTFPTCLKCMRLEPMGQRWEASDHRSADTLMATAAPSLHPIWKLTSCMYEYM